jgi:glycosyltransferase involved in cell wall biosynthesis
MRRIPLSIIVTWRARKELAQTLPVFVEVARRIGGEVILVNYGGDSQDLANQARNIDQSLVRFVHVPNTEHFHKARAQNVGAYHARGDTFFFCDCDIIVKPEDIVDLAKELKNSDASFATLKGVSETISNARKAGNVVRFGYVLHLRIANGRELEIIDHEEDADDGSRNAPGLLLVGRDHFMAINGYNGRLHGWGWEDQDIIARLTLAAGLRRLQRHHAIHISHDDDVRIANYPPVKDRWESRDRMFRQALAFYDQGDMNGTFEEDGRELEHHLAKGTVLEQNLSEAK